MVKPQQSERKLHFPASSTPAWEEGKMADAKDGVLRPAGAFSAPISFSFNRTSARRRLAGDAAPEKDFLKTEKGRELQR